MKRAIANLVCGLTLLSFVSGVAMAQDPDDAWKLGPDQPGQDEVLNRQLWEYAKKTPYEVALAHIAAVQKANPPADSGEVTLPTGWKITPAGNQVEVGRFPCEAVSFAGKIVVLNNGYYDLRKKEQPEVSVVDPATGEVNKLSLPSLFPSAQVGLDQDLYISGGSSQQVFRLDSDFKVRAYTLNGYTAGLAVIDREHLAVASLVAAGTVDDYKNGRYQQGELTILNTTTGQVERPQPVGYFPYAVRWVNGKLYVTVLGENRLRVYNRKLDLIKTLEVGRTPQDLCVDGDRLYVVNTGSDSLSVVDTHTDRVVTTVDLHHVGARFGSAPTSCAVDGEKLYVTLAGVNAIAVLDKRTGKRLGSIPTGWYPTKVVVNDRWLLALSGKGIRLRRPNPHGPYPGFDGPQYVLTLLHGALGILPRTDIDTKLPDWTRQVDAGSPIFDPHKGFELPIKHIFYIVRENRTFDQVMGDLPGVEGDPELNLFGQAITPNGHQLAQDFVALDNYFADGEISVLGHSYTTSGYASPFLQWLGNMNYSGRYGAYPFGTVPAVTSPAYLWDALDQRHVDYKIYGENYYLYTRAFDILKEEFGPDSEMTHRFYTQMMALASRTDRGNAFYQSIQISGAQADTPEQAQQLLGNVYFPYDLSLFLLGDYSLVTALEQRPALRRRFAEYLTHYALNYRSWDLATSDMDRVRVWKDDFQRQLQRHHVPQLQYIWLPNDHTAGRVVPGLPTPKEFVAQNDAALGRIVETISHSPLWKDSLILVTEDDAQNGPDHVDATRTVALAAGPYVRRGAVIKDRYDQLSLLRTIEMILGLPPLNQNDALAVPMFSLFTDRPDERAYTPPPPSAQLSESDKKKYEGLGIPGNR